MTRVYPKFESNGESAGAGMRSRTKSLNFCCRIAAALWSTCVLTACTTSLAQTAEQASSSSRQENQITTPSTPPSTTVMNLTPAEISSTPESHDPSLCAVHHLRMTKRPVPIVYHCNLKLVQLLHSARDRFPHGEESYYGGDVATPGRKTVMSWQCPACVEGLRQWLSEHEQELNE